MKIISNRIDKDKKVTIPCEICDKIGLIENDVVEIYMRNDTIYIKKSIDSCIFCGSIIKLKKMQSKCICKDCLNILNKMNIEDIVY